MRRRGLAPGLLRMYWYLSGEAISRTLKRLMWLPDQLDALAASAVTTTAVVVAVTAAAAEKKDDPDAVAS